MVDRKQLRNMLDSDLDDNAEGVEERVESLRQILEPDDELVEPLTQTEQVPDLKTAYKPMRAHMPETTESRIREALYTELQPKWEWEPKWGGKAVERYDSCFAYDGTIAVGISALNPECKYLTTIGKEQERRLGTKLDLVFLNRSAKVGIRSLSVARYSYLVDDMKRQYECQEDYLHAYDDCDWRRAPDVLAPGARIEAFLLFPPRLEGSTRFVSWYWSEQLEVGRDYKHVEFTLRL